MAAVIHNHKHLRNPNFERRRRLPRVILLMDTEMVKVGQILSNLVKKSKTGQRRRVYWQILIFLDVSAKLDCRIENGLFRKLI